MPLYGGDPPSLERVPVEHTEKVTTNEPPWSGGFGWAFDAGPASDFSIATHNAKRFYLNNR